MNFEPVEGNEIALFKMNGARISNEFITLDKKEKPWTVGNYLWMLKKSQHSVKIGVGYVSSSTKKDAVIDLSQEQVFYS